MKPMSNEPSKGLAMEMTTSSTFMEQYFFAKNTITIIFTTLAANLATAKPKRP